MTHPTATQRPGLHAWIALPMLLVAALSAPAAAQAAESDAAVTVSPLRTAEPIASEEWQLEQQRRKPETGPVTRHWLQMQGAREQASVHRPSLSGPALRRTHDRYLKSFEVEIPQQLRESLPTNK